MSIIQNNKLTIIEDDLEQLQLLYKKDWPKNCVGYFWLDNFMRWLRVDATTKHIAFYTLNGDWKSDGLFLVVHRYQLYFTNLSQRKTKELETALELLNWQHGFKISSIYETHQQLLNKVLTRHAVEFGAEKKTNMYYMFCHEAKNLDIGCPAGYYVATLSLQHAALINDHWSARHNGSLKLIQLLITHNTNIGLFEESTGKICAWCLRLQSGFLGALEVLKGHQRRGLGAVVARAITKSIATELEHDVTALVNESNEAASKLFENLGFTLLKGVHYYWTMSHAATNEACWTEANDQ